MARSTVKINFNKLPQIARKSPGIADDAVQAIAREGERYVKQELMNSSPPGRRYKVGKSRYHTASRPGYPPNVDTGKLRAGIYTYKGRPLVWIISAGDTEYAPILEFGSVNMAPRPFMGPMAAFLQRNALGIARTYLRNIGK